MSKRESSSSSVFNMHRFSTTELTFVGFPSDEIPNTPISEAPETDSTNVKGIIESRKSLPSFTGQDLDPSQCCVLRRGTGMSDQHTPSAYIYTDNESPIGVAASVVSPCESPHTPKQDPLLSRDGNATQPPRSISSEILSMAGLSIPFIPRLAFMYDRTDHSDPSDHTPKFDMRINRLTARFVDPQLEGLYSVYILWERARLMRMVGFALVAFCLFNFVILNGYANVYVLAGHYAMTFLAATLAIYLHLLIKRLRRLLRITAQEYRQHRSVLSIRHATPILNVYSMALLCVIVYFSMAGRWSAYTLTDAPLTILMVFWCGPLFSHLPFIQILIFDIWAFAGFAFVHYGRIPLSLFFYYAVMTLMAMFSGAFLLYNKEIDQRARYRALLKKTGENFKTVMENSVASSEKVRSSIKWFRFKDPQLHAEFQLYIEDRSMILLRLSIFFQILSQAFNAIPGSPLQMDADSWIYTYRPAILIPLWSLYFVMCQAKKWKEYRSKVGLICCFASLSVDFFILLHLGPLESNRYFLNFWRIFEASATSLCIELRHLCVVYFVGFVFVCLLLVFGQPFLTPYIFVLSVLMLYFGLVVGLQANMCAKVSFMDRFHKANSEP